MTEDDIMKAIETCGGYTCNGCPMERRINCRGILARETLKMTKKWKTEIDMLRIKDSGSTAEKIKRFARALSEKNKKNADDAENILEKTEFRGIQMGALLIMRYIAGLEKGIVEDCVQEGQK